MDTLPANGNAFPKCLRITKYDIHEQRFSHPAILFIHYRADPTLYDPAGQDEIAPLGPRCRDLLNPALAAVPLESSCRSLSPIAETRSTG